MGEASGVGSRDEQLQVGQREVEEAAALSSSPLASTPSLRGEAGEEVPSAVECQLPCISLAGCVEEERVAVCRV